ncbi:GT-D fold domain-containing protein [Limosilactobacillus balticus]|uniref:GT-D fold domain-containing glycosyltransferase n=1 Tax=Limosilactobacillus balticus TaxID=2759747 RepID=UPI001E31171B|nr:GT-D fold domain-containing glycosyltransferase [Limosilactobacillus balticus]MCD7135782.1 GT-D fold domain-containing protein [Limosilactobacillus balticus]
MRKFIRNNSFLYGIICLYRYARYRRQYERLDKDLHILDVDQTLDYLATHNISLARFGDSELKMLYCDYSIGFQRYDPQLAARLHEIIDDPRDPEVLMVALPHHLVATDNARFDIKTAWWSMLANNYSSIRQNLNSRLTYLDSEVSRTYSEYQGIAITEKAYTVFKRIWRGKRVLIVEGDETRMGMGNDLFTDATELKRILVPRENAFESYDQIKKIVEEKISQYDFDLVVTAIGPTATVLAYDLSPQLRVLDLGHLDIQYEYYRHHSKKMTQIRGKYTNEVNMTTDDIYKNDAEYLSQIIGRVE